MCGTRIFDGKRARYHGYIRPSTMWRDKEFSGSAWTATGEIQLRHGLVIPCCLARYQCTYDDCSSEPTTGREFFLLYEGGPVFWVAVVCLDHQLDVSPPPGAAAAFLGTLPAKDWKVHYPRWMEAFGASKKATDSAQTDQLNGLAEVQMDVVPAEPDDLDARMAVLLDTSDNVA